MFDHGWTLVLQREDGHPKLRSIEGAAIFFLIEPGVQVSL